MLAIGPIEQKEKTITAGLREKLALLALELRVEQDGRFDGVPVVNVVWRRLKIPSQLPSVRIQGHYGTSVEIVAGAPLAYEHRIRIARAPIEQIQLTIVRAGHPRHATTVEESVGVFGPCFRTRLARVWLGVPAPLNGSGFRIPRLEETSNIRNIPRDAHNHVIAYNERRHRRKVAEF